MEQRLLGEHGLILSSLGLGTRTWGLDTDPHEAAEMLTVYRDTGGSVLEVEDDPRFPEPAQTVGELTRPGELQLILRSTGRLPARGSLLDSLDRTLTHLGADHVDLWIPMGPRREAPLAELVEAAEVAWRSGRARYVGLGGLSWWDGGAATTMGPFFSAWAGRLSILEPALSQARAVRDAGLGLIAGAPLAGGMLTGKYRHSTPPDARATSPRFKAELAPYEEAGPRAVIEATCRAAEGLERSPAQVALAWARDEAGVTSAIIGPRGVRQLEHLLQIDGWRLPRALRDVLTEVALRPN